MSSKKYIHYGHKHFQPEMFCPISNRGQWVKPNGGLWASPMDASFGWKDWCYGSNFRECNVENSFTFTLSESARVLVIDNNESLLKLPQIVPEYMHDLWCMLDFEKLVDEYDAIELDMSSDGRLYWSLYGWDCDCILVMNPNVVMEVAEND